MQNIDFTILGIAELRDIIANAQAELSRREATKTSLRVSIGWRGYNDRRYSRPWIAVVTAWPVGDNPTLSFGSYIGTDAGGELEIMAKPGDIVRYGQKDLRNPRHTTNEWAVVESDGATRDITAAEARALFKAGGAS